MLVLIFSIDCKAAAAAQLALRPRMTGDCPQAVAWLLISGNGERVGAERHPEALALGGNDSCPRLRDVQGAACDRSFGCNSDFRIVDFLEQPQGPRFRYAARLPQKRAISIGRRPEGFQSGIGIVAVCVL